MEDVSTQLEKTAVYDEDGEIAMKSGNIEIAPIGSVGKSVEVSLAGSVLPQTIGPISLGNGNTTTRTSKFYDERESLLIEEDR
jgi:hypothetical protein